MTALAKAAPKAARAQFNWEDPFLIEEQLSEDERMIRDMARGYAQEKLMPRVKEAYATEKTDRAIFHEMGELGLLGPTTPEEYGGAGTNYVSYGLVAREVFPTVPPAVEYRLTALGDSLIEPFGHLVRWADRNARQIHAARSQFDAGMPI